MVADQFPSMKARKLYRVLTRDLGYQVARQKGSHKQLRAEGRPRLLWAHHDGVTLAPGMVRDVLCKQVGLDADQALRLL